MSDPAYMQLQREWYCWMAGLNVEAMFANAALRERAFALYEEDACYSLEITSEWVTARVAGRGAVYAVRLYRRAGWLLFDCDCPSTYYPCKHAGALLFTLQENPERATKPAKPAQHDPVPAGVRGGKVKTGSSAAEDREYIPGAVLEVVEAAADGKNRISEGDFCFGADAFEEKVGRVSETARFRPAFRLVGVPDPYMPEETVLGIEAVLVYIRKDGADGRIEAYSYEKERRSGDEATEKLLRSCTDAEWKTRRAIELLKIWYGDSIRRGSRRLDVPVDLFLERAGRLERERGVTVRGVRTITIQWTAERRRRRHIEYRPELQFLDAEGYGERFDGRDMLYEHDGELLIIPNQSTGSLWYLFDTDLPREHAGKIRALASVLNIPQDFGAEEVRTFADLCRSRFSGLLEVDEVPGNVHLVAAVPTPILDFGIKGYTAADNAGSDEQEITLRVRFRYGREHERAPGSEALIPISEEEALSLTASIAAVRRKSEGAPEGKGTGGRAGEKVYSRPAWYLAPQEEAELHCIKLIGSTLKENGYPMYRKAGEPPLSQFTIEGVLHQVLSAAAEELWERGFEIRVGKEKIQRPPGKSSLRVAASGEEWLKIEPGFDLEEGFVAIEKVEARGIVKAGGTTYILPPGTDTEALRSALNTRRIGRRDMSALEHIADTVSNPEHPGLGDFFSLRKKLAAFSGLTETEAPAAFKGELRPYQKSGLAWLWFLHTYGLGGCLADDMGLGKTIQTLSLFAKAREAGEMRRALVVCPVSTLGNWMRELERFTPQFSVRVHAGKERGRVAAELEGEDIILVGYATLLRDADLLRKLDFDYLVLDEAQAIKNPKAKRRKAVASLDVPHRLALTGTPMENSTGELWSLLDILMPGILGTQTDFNRRFGMEIEGGKLAAGKVESGEEERAAERLRRLIRPLVLRRTKKAVAPELPPKEEVLLYADPGKRQKEVYESLRLHFADEIEQLLNMGKGWESNIELLRAMLRLRQAAILPALVDPQFSEIPSAKMDLLYDRLIELRGEGNKALVFSQFTSVLDEVELRIAGSGLRQFRLEGSTPQLLRDKGIADFQAARGAALFLISLKAGGVGINLTAADYVFLLDPWWNPAVESQAIDRAHRIGRVNAVFAYRLVSRGTIEEKMLRLQERKRRITDHIIRGESGALRELSEEDIRELFR